MKKHNFLFLLIICMLVISPIICKAQESTIDKAKLVGTWEQCDSMGRAVQVGTDIHEYKIITPQTFNVLQVNKPKGIFIGIFFGVYSIENDIYTETICYTIPQGISSKGIKNLFYIGLKKDLLYLYGINNQYKQIWKKVDPLTISK